jgi:hypothetical protein
MVSDTVLIGFEGEVEASVDVQMVRNELLLQLFLLRAVKTIQFTQRVFSQSSQQL